jgi:hypothetical protein
MTALLNPCPKCGADVDLRARHKGTYIGKCRCGHLLDTKTDDEKKAVEVWNGQAAAAAPDKIAEALKWYGTQASLCRQNTTAGDAARNALDFDGGQRARKALGTEEL